MTETREEHLARRPEMDGWLEVFFNDGTSVRYPFNLDRTWTIDGFGITVKDSEQLGPARPDRPWRTFIPLLSFKHYDIVTNSPEYRAAMVEWLMDCNHDWVTHPQVGHYCKHCRLDMADMPELIEHGTLPDLVTTDPSIDKAAEEFSGVPGDLS